LQSILQNFPLILACMMLVVMTTVSFYLITVYTPTFGKSVLKLSSTDSLLVTFCVGLSNFILLPVMGAVSDRIGRAPVLAVFSLLAMLTAYPSLAWLVTVLWVTGVMPLVLDELDQVTWKVGSGEVSLRKVIEGTLSAILVMILSLSLSSVIESRLLKGAAADDLSLRKIAANAIAVEADLVINIGTRLYAQHPHRNPMRFRRTEIGIQCFKNFINCLICHCFAIVLIAKKLFKSGAYANIVNYH
jgi:MFS family permease